MEQANTALELDRVRRNTSQKMNDKIDRDTRISVISYSAQDNEAVEKRVKGLEKEWDIERWLEATSGFNVLLGLALGFTVNKKWLILSAVSSAFLVQHAIQGWCPPLPLFRALGIRTTKEIDEEKKALQQHLAQA